MVNQQAYFDQLASGWDDNPTRVDLAKSVGSAIIDYIPIEQAMQVIDFGCGSGLISLQLANQVNSIIAMDTSSGMLEVLQEKMKSAGLTNVETQLITDDEQAAFTGQVDLVIASMVLHHVPDLISTLKKIASWLKPGGWLAISDLEPEDGHFHPPEVGPVHHGIDANELQSSLEDMGVNIKSKNQVYNLTRINDQQEKKNYPVFLLIGKKQ